MASLLALAALHDAGAPSAADEGLQQLLRLLEADGWPGASGAGRGVGVDAGLAHPALLHPRDIITQPLIAPYIQLGRNFISNFSNVEFAHALNLNART